MTLLGRLIRTIFKTGARRTRDTQTQPPPRVLDYTFRRNRLYTWRHTPVSVLREETTRTALPSANEHAR
jgi:hypothetical protein